MPSILSTSAQAVIQVLLLCSAGAFLERSGYLGRVKRGGLSAVCFHILLPLMNFANILQAGAGTAAGSYIGVICSYSLMLHLWGALLGLAAARLVSRPTDEFGAMHIVLCSSFGNNNGIPLLLFPSLILQGALLLLPGGSNMALSVSYGIGVIALYNIPSAIIMWSFGPYLLRVGGRATAAGKSAASSSSAPKEVSLTMTRVLGCVPGTWRLPLLRVYEGVSGVITPPVVGALAGLFMGSIPALRALLVDRQAVPSAMGADADGLLFDGWAEGSLALTSFNVTGGGGGGSTTTTTIPAMQLLHNASGWFVGVANATLSPLGIVASLTGGAAVAEAAAAIAAASTSGVTINVAPLGPSLFAAAITFGSAAPPSMALIIGSSMVDGSGGGGKAGPPPPPPPSRDGTKSGVADGTVTEEAMGEHVVSQPPPPLQSPPPPHRRKAAPLHERAPSSMSLTGVIEGEEEGGGVDGAMSAAAPPGDYDIRRSRSVGDGTMMGIVEEGDDDECVGDGTATASGDGSGASPAVCAVAVDMCDGGVTRSRGNSGVVVVGAEAKRLDVDVALPSPPAVAAAPPTSEPSSLSARCRILMGGVRWQVVLAVGVCRLLLMPCCGMITVLALLRAGALPPNDATLVFVLLLESAVPSAMNLQILCEQVSGDGSALARVIAVTYLAAVFTLTAWIAVFLLLLQQL